MFLGQFCGGFWVNFCDGCWVYRYSVSGVLCSSFSMYLGDDGISVYGGPVIFFYDFQVGRFCSVIRGVVWVLIGEQWCRSRSCR